MPKYKILKAFEDIHSKEVYTEGQEIEMTEERAAEASKNLDAYGGTFFELIEEVKAPRPPNKLTVDELKAELDKVGIQYESDAKKAELVALFEGVQVDPNAGE